MVTLFVVSCLFGVDRWIGSKELILNPCASSLSDRKEKPTPGLEKVKKVLVAAG